MENTVQKRTQEQTEESKPNLTGIPTQMKRDFERRSALSFDDVRVHYNSDKPAQLQALAYTQGTQVYVGPGQERHLSHELGHVVQQKAGIVMPTAYLHGIPVNTAPTLEHQADCFGALYGVGEKLKNTCIQQNESETVQGYFTYKGNIISNPEAYYFINLFVITYDKTIRCFSKYVEGPATDYFKNLLLSLDYLHQEIVKEFYSIEKSDKITMDIEDFLYDCVDLFKLIVNIGIAKIKDDCTVTHKDKKFSHSKVEPYIEKIENDLINFHDRTKFKNYILALDNLTKYSDATIDNDDKPFNLEKDDEIIVVDSDEYFLKQYINNMDMTTIYKFVKDTDGLDELSRELKIPIDNIYTFGLDDKVKYALQARSEYSKQRMKNSTTTTEDGKNEGDTNKEQAIFNWCCANNYMLHILSLCNKDFEFTTIWLAGFLQYLNALVTGTHTRTDIPSWFRNEHVGLRGKKVMNPLEIIYFVYPVLDIVSKQLNSINKEKNISRRYADAIALASGVYTALISVHPFQDGNGRTLRLFTDFILMFTGLPPVNIEALSRCYTSLFVEEGVQPDCFLSLCKEFHQEILKFIKINQELMKKSDIEK